MSAQPQVKLAKGIVAPGRSVQLARGPDGARGPGEEVELPEAEIKTLRARGYLVDPNAKPVPKGDGPSFGVEKGVAQVKAA